MSASFLDQLNLTPQERRIVVGIAVVVFFVLNLLLVWPHFSDLTKVRAQLEATRNEIQKQNKVILKDVDAVNGYKVQLKKLERQQGGGIVNQQVALQRTVSDQAMRTGVTVDEIKPASSGHPDTNEFYVEQSVKIDFETQEPQLVNFLYNVGNDPAMIRVHELSLKTADANRYRLKGEAVLTANYAKQPAAGAVKTTVITPKPLPVPNSIVPPKKQAAPGAPGALPARKNL